MFHGQCSIYNSTPRTEVPSVDAKSEQGQSYCANGPPVLSYDRRSTSVPPLLILGILSRSRLRPPRSLAYSTLGGANAHVRPSHCPLRETCPSSIRGRCHLPKEGAGLPAVAGGLPKAREGELRREGIPGRGVQKGRCCIRLTRRREIPAAAACTKHQASSIKHRAPSSLFCSTEARATVQGHVVPRTSYSTTVTASPSGDPCPPSRVSPPRRRCRTVPNVPRTSNDGPHDFACVGSRSNVRFKLNSTVEEARTHWKSLRTMRAAAVLLGLLGLLGLFA